jgi:hypothetical protein
MISVPGQVLTIRLKRLGGRDGYRFAVERIVTASIGVILLKSWADFELVLL